MRWRLFLLLLAGLLVTSKVAAQPNISGCWIFPADNAWNTDISGAPVDTSHDYIANINGNGGGTRVHPDFGSDPTYGIPWMTVPGTQPKVPVTFDYDDESDSGPYPFPPNALVEGGSDSHVIVLDRDNCILYETFASTYIGGAQQAWTAGSGAIFSLNSNAQRPDGWTSADAAGLPILPGLARCEEANSGTINHALRFTVRRTQEAYVYPASHEAGHSTDADFPPMGLRLRLKASYSLAGYDPVENRQALAIANALKKYGMILADNGSNWYISGETNPSCWNDEDLDILKDIPGSAFEVVVSPPPAPVSLYAPSLHLPSNGQSVTNTKPVLGWNTVTSASAYEVRLDRVNPPQKTVATVNFPDYTQYIPAQAMMSGYTYFWQVRALAGDSPTAWSEVRSFTIESGATAAPIRNVFKTNDVTLTWNQIPWAQGYTVEITGGSLTHPRLIERTASQLSATTNLVNGTYSWRMRAKGANNTLGGWSVTEIIVVDG